MVSANASASSDWICSVLFAPAIGAESEAAEMGEKATSSEQIRANKPLPLIALVSLITLSLEPVLVPEPFTDSSCSFPMVSAC
jgi:hypothetical protein